MKKFLVGTMIKSKTNFLNYLKAYKFITHRFIYNFTSRNFSLFYPLLVSGIIFASYPHQLLATLGGSSDSIEKDRMALSGIKILKKSNSKLLSNARLIESNSLKNIKADTAFKMSSAPTNYTVYEFDMGGTFIREFISNSTGIVFAIAWEGLVHPDLTGLLGTYANEFTEGLKQTPPIPGNRFQHTVSTENMVVNKWGLMNNLHGRAYLPSLIPTGVLLNEIK